MVAPLPVIVIFFFELFGAHRDLHSFPTRRSSDLSTPLLVMVGAAPRTVKAVHETPEEQDRKSTRLNSSHGSTSYADCCEKEEWVVVERPVYAIVAFVPPMRAPRVPPIANGPVKVS